MRILLLGKVGQLGWELRRCLASLGNVSAFDYPEIDFRQAESLKQIVELTQPQVIVNAAAFTAVDQAETRRADATAINVTGPAILAEAARLVGAALVHYSTDYVYDGEKTSPYVEADPPRPLNAYGQTKLDGDLAIQAAGGAYLILRTSWVYSTRQGGFVNKVLQWSREQQTMRVVTDQISCPTWARTLAEVTAQLLAKAGPSPREWIQERRGVYHLAGDGYASRLEWTQAILECDPHPEQQVVRQVLPALTADFPTPAKRPLFTALDCSRFYQTFQLYLPPWKEALYLAMQAG
ncbi:MAG TPA: dTDP-4-dehydrorhamnose reductase [Anaerolineaceae bacterium]|nr:dTDP-4-dehydrorhamnose reductase [Anaerolineaceae bacterium]